MGSEWPTVSLGDLTNITSSKRIFASDYCKTGIPFYRSKEVIEKSKGNEISTELFISEDKFKSIKDKFGAPEADDILLTSVGTIGVPYLVRKGETFYFKDGNLTWLQTSKSKVDPKFVLLWLQSNIAKQAIHEVTIGSTQQALTIVALKSLRLTLPPLPEQKAIAHILGSLDDKIELNRKMNATLEGMAQALFKSWFVDFDPVIDNALVAGNPIPDELADRAEVRRHALANGTANREAAKPFPAAFQQTESMGWIPEGWEVQEFGKLAKNIREGVDPKTLPDETPYVGLEHIDRQSFSLSRWGVAPDVDSQKSHFKPDDFLFGKLRPYFHKVCQVNSEGICSTDILVIRPRQEDDAGYVGCQIFEPEFVEYANLRSTGTRMPRASWKDLAKYEIGCPPQEIRNSFNILAKPIRKKCAESIAQNQNLTKLRDTLLPKLISGELRLAEVVQLTTKALS